MAERLAALEDDFAFIAECNIGGEFLGPDKVERLEQIADIEWTRYFDDRLGLSHDEMKRKQRTPKLDLPAVERLLMDKEDHIFPRENKDAPFGDNPHGFDMDVPEHAYNIGEIHNLGVQRGTLTAEERYKINDHIIQTIAMLEQLPFPKGLRRVPEIARAWRWSE